jgi:hypothetical protein
MYSLKITKNLQQNIYSAIEKYYKNHNGNKIKKHFGIMPEQFQNIHQQMDVGGPYDSFDDMFRGFNAEQGTRSKIKIKPAEYKNVILLLLSYNKNIITFEK